MTLIAILTRLDGRISRKAFWIGTLVLTLVFVAGFAAIIAVLGEDAFNGPYGGNSAATLALGTLTLVASIPLMLKRMHDLNHSFRLLVPLFVLEALALAGDIAGWTGSETDPNAFGWALLAVYGLYALALFAFMGFYRGTRGHNDFGPDPLAPEEIPATVSF